MTRVCFYQVNSLMVLAILPLLISSTFLLDNYERVPSLRSGTCGFSSGNLFLSFFIQIPTKFGNYQYVT